MKGMGGGGGRWRGRGVKDERKEEGEEGEVEKRGRDGAGKERGHIILVNISSSMYWWNNIADLSVTGRFESGSGMMTPVSFQSLFRASFCACSCNLSETWPQ